MISLKQQIEVARVGRELFVNALANHKRVQLAPPDGAFYLFFKIDDGRNSTELAKTLVDEANIGLAPGTTFGKGGEEYLRLCFARNRENLEIALERLLNLVGKKLKLCAFSCLASAKLSNELVKNRPQLRPLLNVHFFKNVFRNRSNN